MSADHSLVRVSTWGITGEYNEEPVWRIDWSGFNMLNPSYRDTLTLTGTVTEVTTGMEIRIYHMGTLHYIEGLGTAELHQAGAGRLVSLPIDDHRPDAVVNIPCLANDNGSVVEANCQIGTGGVLTFSKVLTTGLTGAFSGTGHLQIYPVQGFYSSSS